MNQTRKNERERARIILFKLIFLNKILIQNEKNTIFILIIFFWEFKQVKYSCEYFNISTFFDT